jgi:translation elongation factor EF-1alpha
VFNITGLGNVPVGKVEDGTLMKGMKSNLDGIRIEILDIQAHHESQAHAQSGENVGLTIKFLDKVPSEVNKSFLQKIFDRKPEETEYIKRYARKSIEFY